MAVENLKSIIFPDLGNTYEVLTKDEINTELQLKADAIVKSASGEIASFSDGGDDLPMKSLKVNIVPKQSGSGDPSPSNVRPISGTNTVGVTRAGKNLLSDYTLLSYPTYGMEATKIDGGIRLTGVPTWITGSGNTFRLCYARDVYDEVSSFARIKVFGGNANCVINSAQFGSDKSIIVNCRTTATSSSQTIDFYIVVYAGDEPTEYVPYIPKETITTNLPQTVYGGVLDVVSGELTIDKGYVDLGTLTWSYASAYSFFQAPMPADSVGNTNLGGEGVCSNYTMFTGAGNFWQFMGDNQFVYARSGLSSAIRIYLKDTSKGTNASAFKTAMNGVQLVYELATPTEIQLTPTEVKSLLGNNNIWSESGTVEVEYRADTTLAYNKLLSAIASLS